MPGLTLPGFAHERFPNAPLKSMLGQVRFAPILQISDPGYLGPFQEQLRARYPRLEREDEVGVLVSTEGAFRTDASRRWRLSGPDAWSVVLAIDFVTLEAGPTNYTTFQEFRERFGEIWEATLSNLHPSHGAQQGLRYINHLERVIPPAEWRQLINPELLGAIGSDVLGDELQQAICDLRLTRPDGQLVIKHGLVKAGPQQVQGYLLDFDYFTQDVGEDLSMERILNRFEAFHDVIYALFRWCLTDAATEELRGGELSVESS
jgi:uncharacterized protein (TIGR04255 family)